MNTQSNPDETRPTAGAELNALKEAFEVFTRSNYALEESYRLLQLRARELGEELAAKNRELALTNDYLNYILESMTDGVIVTDTEGVITKFNRSASQTLGYSSAEAVGQPFQRLFFRPFTVRAGADAMLLRARDGKQVRVSERNSPIADRTNACIGYVKVFQDLTEIEALREQARRLDRLAALGEMAATVAHEIRNPLGGIRGFAALLARDTPPEDPRARLVAKILSGVRDLNRVVDELLEYTRPVELDLRPVRCADLVGAALAYLELGDRPITVENAVGPAHTALADPDKVRQVLLNLLLNAVESIESAGRIRVTARAAGRYVTLAIADSGRGIPPENLQRVFTPFFTTKEKGSGLGLAVAAKIVEAHGGALRAQSKPGAGATFYVRLPRTDDV